MTSHEELKKNESINYKITYWLYKTAISLKLYKLDFHLEEINARTDEGLMVSLVCEPRWIWQRRRPSDVV